MTTISFPVHPLRRFARKLQAVLSLVLLLTKPWAVFAENESPAKPSIEIDRVLGFVSCLSGEEMDVLRRMPYKTTEAQGEVVEAVGLTVRRVKTGGKGETWTLAEIGPYKCTIDKAGVLRQYSVMLEDASAKRRPVKTVKEARVILRCVIGESVELDNECCWRTGSTTPGREYTWLRSVSNVFWIVEESARVVLSEGTDYLKRIDNSITGKPISLPLNMVSKDEALRVAQDVATKLHESLKVGKRMVDFNDYQLKLNEKQFYAFRQPDGKVVYTVTFGFKYVGKKDMHTALPLFEVWIDAVTGKRIKNTEDDYWER